MSNRKATLARLIKYTAPKADRDEEIASTVDKKVLAQALRLAGIK